MAKFIWQIITFLLQFTKNYQLQKEAGNLKLIEDIKKLEYENSVLIQESIELGKRNQEIQEDIENENREIARLGQQEEELLKDIELIKKSLKEKQNEIDKLSEDEVFDTIVRRPITLSDFD